jgi:hypothetical protein
MGTRSDFELSLTRFAAAILQTQCFLTASGATR